MRPWASTALAALAGAALGAGAVALAAGGAGGDAGVRRYLLAHPEVVGEALDRLRDREAAQALAPERAAIERPVGSAWAGNPKGDVTLVEYYDYNCGYCRASLPRIAELLRADPDVRVVYRELPVLAASSRTAALASLAAARQGRFAGFHQALYAAGPVSDATIAAAAKGAGVSVPAAAPAADQAELAANLATARRLGLTGTPGWVVGDRVLLGVQTLDQLRAAVAAARAR